MEAERVSLALGGGTVVVARGRDVSVRSVGGASLARFAAPTPIDRLAVAPDGCAVLGIARAALAWRWSERDGVVTLATRDQPRDHFGCGFVGHRDRVLTLVAQRGRLRALDVDGEAWSVDLRSPRSFYAAEFIPLPGDRLAVVGHEFSDSLDQIVTVPLDELAADPSGFQRAMARREPISDRAVRLAVGPAGADAVAYRDPEDEEVPADEEEAEELGDVQNFVGLYVREFAGALVQRLAYGGRPGSGSGLLATPLLIAIETRDGMDIVDRVTGNVGSLRISSEGRIALVSSSLNRDVIAAPCRSPAAIAIDVEAGEIVALDDVGEVYRVALAQIRA